MTAGVHGFVFMSELVKVHATHSVLQESDLHLVPLRYNSHPIGQPSISIDRVDKLRAGLIGVLDDRTGATGGDVGHEKDQP